MPRTGRMGRRGRGKDLKDVHTRACTHTCQGGKDIEEERAGVMKGHTHGKEGPSQSAGHSGALDADGQTRHLP